MAKHVWSVLCVKGVTDNQTNQISLLDVLESVRVVPDGKERVGEGDLFHFPCQIVSLWRRSDAAVPETSECRVVAISSAHSEGSAEEARLSAVLIVDLSRTPRFRGTFRIDSLPLRQGILFFRVDHRASEAEAWIEVATLPLTIDIGAEETAAGRKPLKTPAVRRSKAERPRQS
jgi:hypothetical protein